MYEFSSYDLNRTSILPYRYPWVESLVSANHLRATPVCDNRSSLMAQRACLRDCATKVGSWCLRRSTIAFYSFAGEFCNFFLADTTRTHSAVTQVPEMISRVHSGETRRSDRRCARWVCVAWLRTCWKTGKEVSCLSTT